MNLWDYTMGRRVSLRSPHSKKEVEQRINSAAASVFSPFHHGVSGGVYLGRVRLAWSIPMFGNGFRPIFAGRVIEDAGESELRARYGAPIFVLIFLLFWYGLLSIMAISQTVAYLSGDRVSEDSWMVLFLLPVSFALPILIHFVFNMNADKHFEEILELLEREADLR